MALCSLIAVYITTLLLIPSSPLYRPVHLLIAIITL